jgi:hypothetical protein
LKKQKQREENSDRLRLALIQHNHKELGSANLEPTTRQSDKSAAEEIPKPFEPKPALAPRIVPRPPGVRQNPAMLAKSKAQSGQHIGSIKKSHWHPDTNAGRPLRSQRF